MNRSTETSCVIMRLSCISRTSFNQYLPRLVSRRFVDNLSLLFLNEYLSRYRHNVSVQRFFGIPNLSILSRDLPIDLSCRNILTLFGFCFSFLHMFGAHTSCSVVKPSFCSPPLFFSHLSLIPYATHLQHPFVPPLRRHRSAGTLSRRNVCAHTLSPEPHYGNTSARFCQHQLLFKSALIVPRTGWLLMIRKRKR